MTGLLDTSSIRAWARRPGMLDTGQVALLTILDLCDALDSALGRISGALRAYEVEDAYDAADAMARELTKGA